LTDILIFKMKQNATIVYLVRNTKRDIDNLLSSLKMLDVNFNKAYNYPIILFHENITSDKIEYIKCSTTSILYFEKIVFEVPQFLNKDTIPEIVYVNGFGFSMGYRHMCRFFSGIIYHHPALKSFDYYWRLDTDSFLRGKIEYDVFEFMHDNNYIYGYVDSGIDTATVDELRTATERYISKNKIKNTGTWDGSAYGTNFEISKIDFWNSEKCIDFFNYLDNLGGIFRYRWGDHIIHFITVSLFCPDKQIHKFTDIAYQHQDVYYNYTLNISGFSKNISLLKKGILQTILKSSALLKRKSKRYRAYRSNKNGF